jgi:hypothetical protein
MYKLTYLTNLSNCERIAYDINKDHSDYPAKIVYNENTEEGYVALEDDYWKQCQEYVKQHCRLK